MNKFFIARPGQKAAQTVNQFEMLGLVAIPYPVIDIQLLSLDDVMQARHGKFEFDTIIITSTYAVDWLTKLQDISVFDFTKTKNIVCVGDSTAEKLRPLLSLNKLGQINIYVADPPNSEGILASKCMQLIEHKHIGIIKGKGGRNLLESELIKKQAQLTVLDVYQRMVNTQKLKGETIIIDQTDCIVATSVEIVDAIFKHYDNNRLKSVDWIVPSTRIKQHVTSLGVAKVLTSENASAHSLAQSALQLVKKE